MKITAIKQQVKNHDRYSIYVDDAYAFSLSSSALLDQKLILNQELTGSELKKLQQLSGDDKLYALALRYAVMRPRSTWELEQYLQRKEASAPLTSKILSKLRDLSLLSDQSFAESWVRSRRLLKPVSQVRLVAELRQKHIASDIIDAVLQADDADEVQVLRELVSRKQRQSKYQDSQKLMQYLARQGFNYDDIKTVLSESSGA